jgi:hypothetical protein
MPDLDIEPKPLGIKCNGQEISNVASGSQAEKLGIKVGWKVIEIGGTKVTTTQDVTKALGAGKKGGKKYKAKFIDPKAGAPASSKLAPALGDKGNSKELDIEPKPLGIKCNGQEISNVAGGSQAEKLGIKVGWKVIEIGGTKVTTTQDVTKALGAGKKGGKKYKAKFVLPGASSTKEATAKGHKVTTVVESNSATAAAPAEPAAGSPEDEAAKKRAEEEAEAAKKAAEDAAAAAAKAEEERQARMNGEVTLKYEMYDEKFTIKGGQLVGEEFSGSKYIDEEYALSFVMPNCRVHLSTAPKQEVALAEGDEKFKLFVKEEPEGVYVDLENEQGVFKGVYHVIVVEDDEQAKKDQERMKAVWAHLAEDAPEETSGGKARAQEGCSCLWGNPCADKYICEDWDNRNAVSTANGWAGAAASAHANVMSNKPKILEGRGMNL